MSPPGGAAATRSGRGTTHTEARGQTQQAINAAHVALAKTGIAMSPSRVSRIVRRFEAHVERNGWTGFSFPQFLADGVAMSPEQRSRLLCDPDLARLQNRGRDLDPVGEEAAWHVDGGRSW